MKILGRILLLIGVIGLIVFGIQAINHSDSFSLFGLNVAISNANWTPVIISGVILCIGGILSFKRYPS